MLTASGDGFGYASTGNVAGSNQRRTLTLSNGEVIWDLAGNVWEWVDQTIDKDARYHGGAAGLMAYHLDDEGRWGRGVASNVPSIKRPPGDWNAAQGMGRYLDGYSTAGANNVVDEAPDLCAGTCAPVAAFLRGGGFGQGESAGVYALSLDAGRAGSNVAFGFRCAAP